MARNIKISFREVNQLEFESGTTLHEISKSFSKYFEYPILIGRLDNDVVELGEAVNRSHTAEFYDRSSSLGNSVYGSTLQFLVILGVKRLFGNDTEVLVEHSIDKGFYCEIENREITKLDIQKLEETMKNIVAENKPIDKLSVSRLDAIKYFKSKKQDDKVINKKKR